MNLIAQTHTQTGLNRRRRRAAARCMLQELVGDPERESVQDHRRQDHYDEELKLGCVHAVHHPYSESHRMRKTYPQKKCNADFLHGDDHQVHEDLPRPFSEVDRLSARIRRLGVQTRLVAQRALCDSQKAPNDEDAERAISQEVDKVPRALHVHVTVLAAGNGQGERHVKGVEPARTTNLLRRVQEEDREAPSRRLQVPLQQQRAHAYNEEQHLHEIAIHVAEQPTLLIVNCLVVHEVTDSPDQVRHGTTR
mmetsp:Transcript_75527/g.209858  ORF Transcript_75527/g.209858 Transcript_75527/m.209858 type:complete len:251 (+) Transcript_75527:35-787(+)